MRLYSGQFNLIAEEIVKTLLKTELIEVAERREAELDVVSVLRNYNRVSRQIMQQARDAASKSGRENVGRLVHQIARQQGVKMGEDAIEYVINQIIEVFLQSAHIDEIYGSDIELRASITPIIKKFSQSRDDELDQAVKGKIRNLEEGSAAWDIEYERVMKRVKNRKGLSND